MLDAGTRTMGEKQKEEERATKRDDKYGGCGATRREKRA